MFSILVCCRPEEQDALVAHLIDLGMAGLIEEKHGLRAFFPDGAEAERALAALGYLVSQTRTEPETDYSKNAPGEWDPVPLGDSFFIAPSGSCIEIPERKRLLIDSEEAFGSGRHESTLLMIRALEELVRPDQTVVDVGCGSGILSLAANMLGAKAVVGCDIHEASVFAARRNTLCPLFVGSADCLADQVADLILVNISARVIDWLAGDLRRIIKADGLIVASGFVEGDVPAQISAIHTLQENDWLCWICRRDSIRTGQSPAPLQPYVQQWW